MKPIAVLTSLVEKHLFTLVILLYGVALLGLAFSKGVGTISWGLWQFLDPDVLREAPLSSLWLLHAQPPMQNAILALALVVEDSLGLPAQLLVSGVMAMAGGAVLWLIQKIGKQLELAPWMMVLVFGGVVVNSHFWSGIKNFSYELLLAPMALGIVFNGVRYWQTGAFGSLLGALVLASVMTLTRSTFHPIWCGVVAGLIVSLRLMCVPQRVRGAEWSLGRVTLILLLVATGFIWPAKNAFVFGEWVHSSWDGFNLSRGYVALPTELDRFLGAGEVPIELQDWNASFDPTQYEGADQVMAVTRSNGVENWNHYMLLATRKSLVKASIVERLDHPHKWFSTAMNNYFMWSTPSYVDPYKDSPETREGYGRVKTFYDSVFYNDLRPWLGEAASDDDLPYARFTLMALVYIPLFVLLTLIQGVRGSVSKTMTGPALLIVLLIYSWPMLISMLTDGQESTRFRIAVEPLFWLGWGLVLRAVVPHNKQSF